MLSFRLKEEKGWLTAIAVFVPDHLTDDGLIPWPSSTEQMNIQLSFNTLQIFKTITKLKTWI